ncbi:MAG: hypothetical protein PVS3B3_08980 [Ktedonobacteraceae bacterium]
MIEGWLQQTTEEFWNTLGSELPYPRTFQPSVSRSFPVSIITLPKLSIVQIEAWLQRQHIPFRFLCQDRSLCGCIVAAQGHGLIFIDSLDGDNEQRYTIAHEVSHFLLDYFYPRQHVLQLFGSDIRSVLDGQRLPTRTEQFHAVLSGISLKTYVDLMPRTPQGTLDQGYILRAEEKADRLALELLAPLQHVSAQLAHLTSTLLAEQISLATHLLTSSYGLPLAVAKQYSVMLLPPPVKGSTARWLGLA